MSSGTLQQCDILGPLNDMRAQKTADSTAANFVDNRTTCLNAPASLMSLPQELRDSIMKLAYPRFDGTHIKAESPTTRERRRTAQRRAGLAPCVDPFQHKVNDFLISKRFFVDAARAYVKNNTGINEAPKFFFVETSTAKTKGIVIAYATAITIHGEELTYHQWTFARSTRLTALKILVDPGNFEDAGTDLVFQHEVGADEVRGLEIHQSVYRLRHLSRLDICCGVEPSKIDAKSMSERGIWEKNVGTLRDTLNQALEGRTWSGEPWYNTHDSSGRERLYPGSEVLWHEGDKKVMSPDLQSLRRATMRAPAHATGRLLHDFDIPETDDELRCLLVFDGKAVIEWIRHVKQWRAEMAALSFNVHPQERQLAIMPGDKIDPVSDASSPDADDLAGNAG
ncbi:hypothetical protein LTR53_015834 [Teratosphaeriaceae sp. CCFEE 6253]|nr:hypothetical protein LTR53_015834 [Teratosphaeriaceae sp. CCFEE 6253]